MAVVKVRCTGDEVQAAVLLNTINFQRVALPTWPLLELYCKTFSAIRAISMLLGLGLDAQNISSLLRGWALSMFVMMAF
jgi:hypothetical protein